MTELVFLTPVYSRDFDITILYLYLQTEFLIFGQRAFDGQSAFHICGSPMALMIKGGAILLDLTMIVVPSPRTSDMAMMRSSFTEMASAPEALSHYNIKYVHIMHQQPMGSSPTVQF
jgi:hypothetical protein